MGVDTDPTIGKSFGFKRGLDELITLDHRIIEVIRPKSPTLPNTVSEPSTSKCYAGV